MFGTAMATPTQTFRVVWTDNWGSVDEDEVGAESQFLTDPLDTAEAAQESALLWRRLLEVSHGGGQVVVLNQDGELIFGPYCVVPDSVQVA